MPETKEAKGLDAKRQWYLYDQIRPFCASTLQADFTCPKPTIPRPTSNTTTLHVHAEIPSVSTQPEATPMGSEKIKFAMARNLENVLFVGYVGIIRGLVPLSR